MVRAAHAPWVLHIASHGLFLNGPALAGARARNDSLRGGASGQQKKRPTKKRAPKRKAVMFEELGNPALSLSGDVDSLSRSALILANAAQGQTAASTAEDGLLTAEEARSLDLSGTQLVVLSACETGQGDPSAGHGVYGLRRAFLVAGAETLVTSLWHVSDDATGKLMELYYRKLLTEKKGRLEGMQEAMQQIRRTYSHPYYWAPFQVIGNDGVLRLPLGSSRSSAQSATSPAL